MAHRKCRPELEIPSEQAIYCFIEISTIKAYGAAFGTGIQLEEQFLVSVRIVRVFWHEHQGGGGPTVRIRVANILELDGGGGGGGRASILAETGGYGRERVCDIGLVTVCLCECPSHVAARRRARRSDIGRWPDA